MKILITSAKKSVSYELASLLIGNQIVYGEENYSSYQFPSIDSASLAHELLTYCLDHEIERVFPIRNGELETLLVTKVLFEEFGIEIMIPDPHHELVYNSAIQHVDNFNGLSSKLLALGYPDKKFAIGKANHQGDLIFINDEQKDFNQVWSKISEISFVQMGKLFNQVNFDPMVIYQIEEGLQQINVLFSDGLSHCMEILPYEITKAIQNILSINNANGFYQVYLSGEKIIRIKNIAI